MKGEFSIEVRQSRIAGFGLYACRPYEAGEVVLSWDLSHAIDTDQLMTLPESERRYTHPLDEKRTLIVQPPERFVNHSCDNNTIVRNFSDVAVRRIEVGEEITSDYSIDGSLSEFACECGAVNCRGTISQRLS